MNQLKAIVRPLIVEMCQKKNIDYENREGVKIMLSGTGMAMDYIEKLLKKVKLKPVIHKPRDRRDGMLMGDSTKKKREEKG